MVRFLPKITTAVLLSLTILHTAHSLTTATPASSSSARTSKTSKMSLSAASKAASSSSSAPLKVAIIGGGAAGLVTARVFQRNGIQPTVFEKDSEIGGVWSYHKESKTRPMYRGLRTNLPRELMAYREFPWGGDGTTRSFVTHKEVQEYLQRYKTTMGLDNFIRYRSKVTQLKVLENPSDDGMETLESSQEQTLEMWPRILLEWESAAVTTKDTIDSEIFDAVCICNGHYAAPAFPAIPGLDTFQGKVLHSIEYDDPSIFEGERVLCVGGRASGSDLAREISFFAKHVYLSDTTCPAKDGRAIQEDNVSWVPRTKAILEKNQVSFDYANDDGNFETTPEVDTIVFCSGYDYQFPFLNQDSNLELSVVPGERRVKPLYEQLWHPKVPSLTFIGLQHSVVPFPFFELQAEAVVSQLLRKDESDDLTTKQPNGSWKIPNLRDRLEAAQKDAESGGPKTPGRIQDTHYLGSFQWDECLKYARFAGICDESITKYIRTNQAIYDHSGDERKHLFPGGPDTYRYNSYVRDDDNETFRVVPLHHEMEAKV